MAEDFEKRRSSALCVALWDMCYLIFQVILVTILILLSGLIGKKSSDYSSDFLSFATLSLVVIALPYIVADFYAIIRLIVVCKKQSNVNAKEALFWCEFWYNFTLFFFVAGIVINLFTLNPLMLLTLVIGVSMRGYMFYTVNKYMNALKERMAENENNDQSAVPHTISYDNNLVYNCKFEEMSNS